MNSNEAKPSICGDTVIHSKKRDFRSAQRGDIYELAVESGKARLIFGKTV